MIVYTYHQDISDNPGQSQDQAALVDLWCRNWAHFGWEPVVLGEKHAERHRFFRTINDSDWLKTSVNGWSYIRCCYNKYLAMAEVGGGLLADPDIINYGFTLQDLVPSASLVLYHADVPCMLHGTQHQWDGLAQFFRNCALQQAAGPRCLLDDLSDMNLFLDFYLKHGTVQIEPVIVDRTADCTQAKLVHYFGGLPGRRVDHIQAIKPPLVK